MKVSADTKIDQYIKVEGPDPAPAKPVRVSNAESRWALTADIIRDPEPFGRLSTLASLIQIPGWRTGSWTIKKKENGWKDELSDRFFSVEQVSAAIEARITELGLDRGLIDAYMAGGVRISWQEERAWDALPFDIRMNKFRRVQR